MRGAVLWLQGFALTISLEEAVAVPLLRPIEPSVSRRMLAVLLVNLATHPLVWFFFTRLGWPRLAGATAAEVWAFGFEIVGYRVIFPEASWKRCTATSVAANATSFLLGLVAVELGFFR
jgi:hypothetical protein